MATPNAMPRKTSPIHQQILSSLLATKPVTSTFKRVVKGDDGKDAVVETKVVRQGLRAPLAQNVTELNVDRMAKRWLS
ncbi:hypothetical protein SEA_FAYELY_66 [Mycobacterium phage Fayely]|uniref:Uncharacterized protein n=4 Tax=Fromanvirus alma TaxID=1089111 RepID=A0A142K4X4_9CAUD|nr:hypothetical protein CM07_gp40 [Mycobacterium phage Alma]AMS00866.1 hypothetical protein PBI_EIDSMOE_66 [Mycobacterium phage Eidsmoe]AOT26183.1 hypothetical protein SEA_QOBBIT_66 [Mycobacterium phage Qobbit]AVI03774.1 hypothetical protein SEA_CONQUERAGE_66 [Mycobacterium phage Conquerage]AXC35077.1 hypothetical protein SEA_PRIYA_66 [Mycobacterium phage Priya]AZF93542.1 hypothetical protein SEA_EXPLOSIONERVOSA_66 [Mycobacterium phage ExplosioNervosa]UVF60928.1 hypothetical protein SEA_FAYEL